MSAKTNPRLSQQFSSADSFPFLLLLLYASVELLKGANTSDVMGDQWLMISLLNILSLISFSFVPSLAGEKGLRIFKSPLILSLIALLILASVSISIAINKVESIVVLTRYLNGILMAIVVGTLLWERKRLLRPLAVLFSFLLLIQSIQVISQFFEQINAGNSVNTVIYNLKLNAANKNILAAMLVFKCCLVLYCTHTARTLAGKLLFPVLLFPASLAIFLINARASFLSLILVLILFYIATLFTKPKQASWAKSILPFSVPLLAVLLSFLVSVPVIQNALQAEAVDSPYGTVASRLSSIDLTVAGSNSRIVQWKAAIDHIWHHPLLGCGIGNWKLASIPYEKETVDDLLVAYHVHNDFLELTAETGLLGGLLYICIFGFVLFYALRSLLLRRTDENVSLGIFVLMGVAAYGIDAIFNFPMERPVMQYYFALLLALALGLEENIRPVLTSKNYRMAWLLPALVALPFSYIAWETSRSLREQALVNKDLMSSQPQTKWQDIIDAFPAIPDMNAYTFPIEQVKALYLLNDKKYTEALERVQKSEKVNPFLSLTEYLKARIYFETGKTDSAEYFMAKAFSMKPRAKSHFDLYTNILYQKKDTQQLKNIFRIYSQYRPSAALMNDHVVNMTNLGSPKKAWIPFLDSALKKFPGDTSLTKTMNAIQANGSSEQFYVNYQLGLQYFSKREFKTAIAAFNKAYELEKQYLCLENIGLCYYSMNQFAEAMGYFEKVIQSKLSNDGKAEFFKGACLISSGKASEACPWLTRASEKNYPEARGLINKYCH